MWEANVTFELIYRKQIEQMCDFSTNCNNRFVISIFFEKLNIVDILQRTSKFWAIWATSLNDFSTRICVEFQSRGRFARFLRLSFQSFDGIEFFLYFSCMHQILQFSLFAWKLDFVLDDNLVFDLLYLNWVQPVVKIWEHFLSHEVLV